MKTKEVQIKVKRWKDKANGNSYFSAVAKVFDETGEEIIFRVPFGYGYENAPFVETMAKLRKEGLIPQDSFQGWEAEFLDFGYTLKRDCVKHGKDGL